MKITDQAVPPELADLYDQLVTTQQTNLDGTKITRTKHKATSPKQSKSERNAYLIILEAAQYIAALRGLDATTDAGRTFIAAEARRILSGMFSPQYWQQATKISNQKYASTPTNTDDDTPPSYSYRDEDKLPSDVTYSAGTPTSGFSRTSGAISGGRWIESTWVWNRAIYQLAYPIQQANPSPLLWSSVAGIQATATSRGSRPMFSSLIRAHIVGTPSPYDTDLSAPVQPATSIYWRYLIPEGSPPYYDEVIHRNTILPITGRATIDTADELNRVIIKDGPRPMLGHGYNNNLSVTTTEDETSDLYEVKPCIDWGNADRFIDKGHIFAASVISTTPRDFQPGDDETNQYSIETEAGITTAKMVIAQQVSPNILSWTLCATGSPPAYAVALETPMDGVTIIGNRGTDHAQLKIENNALSFKTPPDYEHPTCAGRDNIYRTCITAVDTYRSPASEDIAIEVRYFYNVTKTAHSDTRIWHATESTLTRYGDGHQYHNILTDGPDYQGDPYAIIIAHYLPNLTGASIEKLWYPWDKNPTGDALAGRPAATLITFPNNENFVIYRRNNHLWQWLKDVTSDRAGNAHLRAFDHPGQESDGGDQYQGFIASGELTYTSGPEPGADYIFEPIADASSGVPYHYEETDTGYIETFTLITTDRIYPYEYHF